MNTEIIDKLSRAVALLSDVMVLMKPPLENNGEMVTVTKAMIKACRTERGGLTGETVRALGQIPAHETQGWLRDLVGASIPREDYERALAGRLMGKRKSD